MNINVAYYSENKLREIPAKDFTNNISDLRANIRYSHIRRIFANSGLYEYSPMRANIRNE